MNMTTSMPKSVLRYVLDEVLVLRYGITLTIEGHSQLTRNNFINDSKIVWNHCPDEITKNSCIHPPKKLIKKFVKTLPM